MAVKAQLLPVDSRQSVRRHIRALRRNLAPLQRRKAAIELDRVIAACPAYKSAKKIALYWPADGEIDLAPLVARSWNMGKHLYLPVLTTGRRGQLRFAPYSRQVKLVNNRFGIPEPAPAAGKLLKAAQLDLLIMPLVAMDRQGNRLGMGGGYYDRTLQNIAGRAVGPVLMGAGYSFQVVERIDRQPWDVTLDGLATDEGLHVVQSSR